MRIKKVECSVDPLGRTEAPGVPQLRRAWLLAWHAAAGLTAAAGWGKGRFARHWWAEMQRQRGQDLRLFASPHAASAKLGPLDAWLPPAKLKKELADWVVVEGKPRHTLGWFGVSGDWDGYLQEVAVLPVFKEAEQLMRFGFVYQATPAYADMQASMRAGRPVRRQHRLLDSAEAIDRYFERYIALFNELQRHGYRSANEERGSRWRMGAVLTVALGPQGELVKLPGAKHRLAIARALNMPLVSARLGMVHADYVRTLMVRDGVDVFKALQRSVEIFRSAGVTSTKDPT